MAVISSQQGGPIRSGRPVQEMRKNTNFKVNEAVALQLSAGRGTSLESEEEKLYQGDASSIPAAKQETLTGVASTVLQNALGQGMAAEITAMVLQDAQNKQELLLGTDQYNVGDANIVVDPNSSSEFVQSEIRLSALEDRLMEMADSRSEGTGWWLKDIPGMFIDGFFTGATAWTDADEEFFQKVGLMSQIVTDEAQWEAFVEAEVIPYFESVGAFGDNWFTQANFARQIASRGYNQYEGVEEGLFVVDVATLGIGGLATKGAKGTVTVVKNRVTRDLISKDKPVTSVANKAGPERASDAAEAMIDNGAEARPAVVEDLIPDVYNPARNADEVVVPEARRATIMQNSRAIREAKSKSEIVAGASARELKALASEVGSALSRNLARPLYQARVVDTGISATDVKDVGIGNYAAIIRLGSDKDGMPIGISGADKYARSLRVKGFDAKKVQVDPYDKSKGYVVEVTQPLNTAKAATPYDVDAVLDETFYKVFKRQNPISKLIGSARTMSREADSEWANVAEGLHSNVKAMLNDKIRTAFNKVPHSSLKAVQRSVVAQRDGTMATQFTEAWMNEAEFALDFFTRNGRNPTREEVQVYNAIRDINDEAWLMSASNLLQTYNDAGYLAIHVGLPDRKFAPALKTNKSELTGKDHVWDATTGAFVNDPTKIPDDWVVWKMDTVQIDPTTGPNQTFRYVVRPKSDGIRVLNPEDVLPYNAGGTRIYEPGANKYLVVADPSQAGGQALLTAPTRKLAKKAEAELDKIFGVMRSAGMKSFDDVVDAGKKAELDNLIAKSEFHEKISSFDEFVEIAKKKGWRIASSVSTKHSGDAVEDLTGSTMFRGGSYENMVNAASSRNPEPLLTFGGDDAAMLAPIDAIQRQIHNATTSMAFRGATTRQMADWLRAVDPDWKPTPGRSTLQDYSSFNMSLLDGKNPHHALLRQERNNIDRRRGISDPAAQWLSQNFSSMVEGVGNMTGKQAFANKTGDLLRKENLLRVNFLSAFAAVPLQLIVQGSMAVLVPFMSKYGSKGSMNILGVRAALHTPWKEIDHVNLGVAAKLSGTSEEEFMGMVKFTQARGNFHVDADALELGADPTSMATAGGRGKLADAKLWGKRKLQSLERGAMVFYKEGERIGRLAANNTAFAEWFARNPGKTVDDLLSNLDEFKQVSLRADDLALNMTAQSRGVAQSDSLRLTTQWLTHSMRVLEALTFGKQLSGTARVTFALGIVLLFGAGNTIPGGGKLADKTAEAMGLEGGSFGHTLIKHGAIDAMLEWAFEGVTGESFKTGFGTRLNPLGGIWSYVKDAWERPGPETAFGPTGQIAGGMLMSVINTGYWMYTGSSTQAAQSLETALRSSSAINSLFTVRGIVVNDAYRSKSGRELTGIDFSKPELALLLIGGGSGKVNMLREMERNDKDIQAKKSEVQRVVKDMRRKRDRAIRDGDYTLADQIAKEVNTVIELSGLPKTDQSDIRYNAGVEDTEINLRLLKDAIKERNEFELEMLRNQNKVGG